MPRSMQTRRAKLSAISSNGSALLEDEAEEDDEQTEQFEAANAPALVADETE